MRDVYKDEDYFRAQLENAERRQTKFRGLMQQDETEQAHQASLNSLYDIQQNIALSLFCIGARTEEVKAELNKAWPLFVDLMSYSLSTSLSEMERKQFVPGGKVSIFPLLVLSDCDPVTAGSIFALTNSDLNYQLDKDLNRIDAGFDPFTYEFARYFDFKTARVHPDLCWPELYGPLHECFSAPEEDRSRILALYVEGWQRRGIKEDIYMKDAHTKATNRNFRGYWCFLAAAVAKMLDIDDSALKSHPHYPYDLRHGGSLARS